MGSVDLRRCERGRHATVQLVAPYHSTVMRNLARYSIAVVTLAALAAGTETYAQPLESTDAGTIDLAFRLLFTVLVAVIVPVYLVKYGPANFLWFSDIGLLGIFAALWLESPLLGSTMALAGAARDALDRVVRDGRHRAGQGRDDARELYVR